MKKSAVLIAVFVLIAFAGGITVAMHHGVKVQNKPELGKYLTDTEGKTLYWFKKDSPGKSACTGACLEKWPAYYRETVAAPEGISKGDFGTITREDGARQTTFRGYPLYYWVNDKNPNDTTGHGVNDVWFVVNPDNFPPK